MSSDCSLTNDAGGKSTSSGLRVCRHWLCGRRLIVFALLLIVTVGGVFLRLATKGVLPGIGSDGDFQIIECQLGDVAPDSKIERTIRLPNPTRETLVIEKVTADCACLSRRLDADTIPPGGHSELHVVYATPAQRGRFEHKLLLCYAGVRRTTIVELTGTIGEWVHVDPQEVDFAEVCIGRWADRIVVVRVREPWPALEREAKLTIDHGKIASCEVSDGGRCLTYRLRFEPSAAEEKNYRGEFLLMWKGRENGVTSLPCVGKAVYPYRATPNEVFFGVVPRGTQKQLEVNVRARLPEQVEEPPERRLIHTLGDEFKVTPIELDGQLFQISVLFAVGHDGTVGPRNGRIQVLDQAGESVISIPVAAFVLE